MRCVTAIGATCSVLLCTGMCICSAQLMHVAPDGGYDKSGLFAYKISNKGVYDIRVVKCESNRVDTLFSKRLSGDYVQSPIVVSNAVVVVRGDGTVTKYALDGNELFSNRVLATNEISSLSGRWDPETIYLVAVHYEGNGPDRKPQYRIVWVDIQGRSPVQKGSADTGRIVRVFRVGDDLVVCGRVNVERIAAPIEFRR